MQFFIYLFSNLNSDLFGLKRSDFNSRSIFFGLLFLNFLTFNLLILDFLILDLLFQLTRVTILNYIGLIRQ